jgi:hypothetical protein
LVRGKGFSEFLAPSAEVLRIFSARYPDVELKRRWQRGGTCATSAIHETPDPR